MSETAVADTTVFERVEKSGVDESKPKRSPEGVKHERKDGLEILGSGAEVQNSYVSEPTVRGHNLELDIEGELDYEIEEGDFVAQHHTIVREQTNNEKNQPPTRISWNEWAGGSGETQEPKLTSEPTEDAMDIQRAPLQDRQRPGSRDYGREDFRRNAPRRHQQDYSRRKEYGSSGGGGGRDRSPPPGLRRSYANNNRRGGANDRLTRTENPESAGGEVSIDRTVVSRGGMPPGLGIGRNNGPPTSQPGFFPPADVKESDNVGGNQNSWRSGGSRMQQRSPPPPPPRFDDRQRRGGGGHPPVRFNRGRDPDGPPPFNRRFRNSPHHRSSGAPLPYNERSFVSQNNRRGRFPDSQHPESYRRRVDRPEAAGIPPSRSRNSISPRSLTRVPASPRRVTLPVRRPPHPDGHYQRGKMENPPRSPVQRRPPSPGFYRQSMNPRRDFMPQHQPRRFPRDMESPPPRQRRHPPPRDEFGPGGGVDRRPRGPPGGDFRQRRINSYDHRRSPSPGKPNKRQRPSSPNRRYQHHREDMRPRNPEMSSPHVNPPNNGEGHGNRVPAGGGDGNFRYSEVEGVWFYVDPRGHTQGPCSIQQFRSWLKTLAEDPQFVDEHKQFRSVPVWKEGMHERFLMTELLERNIP